MTTATAPSHDYPNDDQVEAFYNDDAAHAEQLVDLATLTRNEWQTRLRFDYASRIVADIPEGEADDEDLDWVTNTYMAWVRANEALTAARRELGIGA